MTRIIQLFCLLLLHCLIIQPQSLKAQATVIDTLAFQDFELVPAAPVWNFTGPVIYNSGFSSPTAAPPNSPLGIGGSRAWETTVNSGGLVLLFDNVVVPPGYDSVRFHFNCAAFNLAASTGGPDNLDYVWAEYSTDGGTTWVGRIRVRGAVNNNSFWGYNALGVGKVFYTPASESVFQPILTGLADTLGYSNLEIVFPGNVGQVRIRMTGRSSSSSDTWMIDNMVLTGEKLCTPSSSSFSATACDSYTAPSGNILTSSGTYTDIIPNSTGCDSVMTINLTVNNSISVTDSVSACDNYFWPVTGMTYTVSGTYSDSSTTIVGCDSVSILELALAYATADTIAETACDSYTAPWGTVYSSGGFFTGQLVNAAGCDSILTVDLTINTIDTTVSVNSGTANAVFSANATYQWLDCDNGFSPISGATSPSFSPIANGNYAVAITIAPCTDTSACHNIILISNTQSFANQVVVSPNPSRGTFSLEFNKPLNTLEVTIMDLRGQTLHTQSAFGSNSMNISAQLPGGVYLLEILADGNRHTQKVIVE